MATYLDEILAVTRHDVEQRKRAADHAALERRAAVHQLRGFARSLRHRAQTGPAIIAELKRASPSRGLIRADFNVEPLALMFEHAGAAALSILTEGHFFQGSLRNLERASAAVSIPCLRKDFMVDEFQVLEARAAGADAVLLIASALTDESLYAIAREAHARGLDILCEVHDADELKRVLDLDLGCQALGVNNRNLRTLEVSLETSLELASSLPGNVVRVAESGIGTVADLQRLWSAGYHAFLIGEALMRRPDPGKALRDLLAAQTVMREASA